ncbi:thioredoxin family protein [Jiella sp. MQZ13P-4]|uniref:Thioredoxin family protein n=1 Tax=Jiella sonneratiae TaxID=2816856 RepID=A0ABS3IZN1_9HYPH|nr:thioredoxin family protein [Jiella sonneratiae]
MLLPLVLLAASVAPAPARAAELLMFEQPGCPFCRKFDAEIAPDYPQSRIGRIAPLRRVNIWDDRTGGIAGLTPAAFTPTFVLVGDDGREIGRLEGYPGRKWFYPEIEAILDGRETPSGDAAGRSDATAGR